MSLDQFPGAVSVACAGFGLFATGALQLLAHGRGKCRRAAPVLGAALGSALAAALDREFVAETAALLAGVLVPAVLLRSRCVGRAAVVVVRVLRKPALHAGVLSLLGLGAALGAAYLHERSELASAEVFVSALHPEPVPMRTAESARATTDRGTPVVLLEPCAPRSPDELARSEAIYLRNTGLDRFTIHRGSADDRANCHGWVFTGGAFAVSGTAVPVILVENAYTAVSDPTPGDLVVYRTEAGVAHTAVVRCATPGQSVLVEGKWGCLGVLFHPVEKSLYGTDYAFYRSPRRGHLLAGVGGPDVSPSLARR